MRLRFQSHNYVYEIRSEIKFAKRRARVVKGVHYEGNSTNISYKTYYGSSVPLNELRLLQLARTNIKSKFLKSGGQLIGLQIANTYV